MAESISEGTLKTWNKQVGDSVAADEEVATIETDKVCCIRRHSIYPGCNRSIRLTFLSTHPSLERLLNIWPTKRILSLWVRIYLSLSLEKQVKVSVWSISFEHVMSRLSYGFFSSCRCSQRRVKTKRCR